jgi:uncharacterized protein
LMNREQIVIIELMTIFTLVELLAGGLVTGIFGAMLGLGGGVLLTPFLVLVLGIPIHQAIATSIMAVIATSSAGAAVNLERHLVNLRLGMALEVSTVTGAILGGVTANVLSGTLLTRIFAILLLIVAVLMLRRTRMRGAQVQLDGTLPGTYVNEETGKTSPYTVKHVPGLLGVSFVAGNISGLLGVGGGVFKVPAMNLLGRIPLKAAAATSNFMIGVTAAASAFIYFAHGHVQPLVAATASLGVLGGSLIGVRLSHRIHSTILTWVFAVVMLFLSLQLFWR